MNTAAIIQARMGSTRLPGKVLREIAGKPLLWHVIHRLKKCIQIDQIIIATTINSLDDAIVTFAQQEHISVIRGPEKNVLERYRLAVNQTNADLIIRVTGDSPLIDPPTIDAMILALKTNNADICHGHAAPAGLKVVHEGFTPLSRRAFEQQVLNGGHDPAVQEHVTVKIQHYVTPLIIAALEFNPEHFYSDVRLSVDTPADLEFMETIYQRLGAKAGDANLSDVIQLFKRQPSLVSINAHVHQKKADESTHKLVIRCDGDSAIGLGHVMRCLSLAQCLRDSYSIGIRFIMNASNQSGEHIGKTIVETALFPVDIIPNEANEMAWLDKHISHLSIDGIIFDIRTDLPTSALKRWRASGLVTVCIDDPSDRRLSCDLVFYPPVPQIEGMSWSGFTGTLNCGWEWILLGPSFKRLPPSRSHSPPRLLITMGGADALGITLKVIESLAIIHHHCEPHIILGKAFTKTIQAKALADKLELKIHFHQHIQDMASFLSDMDLAVASFGVTAYELAACGIPSLLLSPSKEHQIAAQALHQHNAAHSLGLYQKLSPRQLGQQIDQFIANKQYHKIMRKAALALNIGTGANNIGAAIKALLNSREAMQ
ncbi:MAG: cytidylyltransferase domain-containing protein [Thiohalomonadales bacterium]